jgi:5-methylcytosine-specific restriction endonuclease McrA
MQKVFVRDKNKQPLMPCFPARARELLSNGKAKVFRLKPFTIILTDRKGGEVQRTELRIDPGSKTTGLAIVSDTKRGPRVIFAGNLEHRGQQVKDALTSRRALRRSRRARKTRYRKPRFSNRTRKIGWLPPSLRSRVDNVISWTRKLKASVPINSIAIETVRFDTQKLLNPETCGILYQQGELLGYEIREYLLEKWGRRCAYCDAKDIPLQIEHIIPRSKGGSSRVSNLTLACGCCNQKKGNKSIHEFVKDKSRVDRITRFAKVPLKDAAAVNATRYAIGNGLKGFNLPISFWSGGRTKFNRMSQSYPKDHWVDAACVGEKGANVFITPYHKPLLIKAQGRGSRQKCCLDRYGFSRTGPKGTKRIFGFQTGDLVKARVPTGKKKGYYVGRISVRVTGNFNIKTNNSMIQGISYKHCQLLQRVDGYFYGVSVSQKKQTPVASVAACSQFIPSIN